MHGRTSRTSSARPARLLPRPGERVLETEALAEPGDRVGVHLEPVAGAEVGKTAKVRSALAGVDLGELMEEILEAGRRDDLDDLARCIAGVPERMPLIPGLEHPGSGLSRHDVVAEQRTERPCQHVRVLVLARVPVERCGERPRCQWMVDNGEAPLGFCPFDLPDDAESPEVDALPFVRPDRDRGELVGHCSSF